MTLIKKIKNNIEFINFMYIFGAIYTIFIASIFLTFDFINMLTYSYIFIAFLIVGILITFFNKFQLKKMILIILMTIFLLISTIFSGDIKTCIWGFSYRHEGLIALLSYLLLFLIASKISNKKYKMILLNEILLLGVVNVGYAILQNFEIIVYDHQYPTSFFGNSNSYGAMCLMYLLINISLFLFTKNKLYILYLPIFTVGFLISGSMGCYLSFAIIIFILGIYMLLKHKNIEVKKALKKTLVLLIIGIIGYFGIAGISNKSIHREVIATINELKSVASGKIDSSFGTNRIEIWRAAIKEVPKYMWHGVGIDRFYYALDNGNFRTSLNEKVDKAHNEYLQILITEGIFMLITYLSFLFVNIKQGIKYIKDGNYWTFAFLLPVLAYIIQAFFNISVTRVAPIYFILMGLMVALNKEKKKA